MGRYVHSTGTEYSTGMLIFTMIILVVLGLVVAGAIAAIPVMFGAITGAMWVWGTLGGIWTVGIACEMVRFRGQSRKLS